MKYILNQRYSPTSSCTTKKLIPRKDISLSRGNDTRAETNPMYRRNLFVSPLDSFLFHPFSTTRRCFTLDSDPCQVCKHTNVNPPLTHQTLTTSIDNFTLFPSINIWQFFNFIDFPPESGRVQNSNSKYLMARWSEAILKSVRRWIEWGSCIGSLINYTRSERDVCCSNTDRIMV